MGQEGLFNPIITCSVILLQICKHDTFEFAHVVFSSSRHCDFADDSVDNVQINMRFIGLEIKLISESLRYGCGI